MFVRFIALLLVVATLSIASLASASNIAADQASNYTLGSSFNGANGGYGFGAWTVNTTPSGSYANLSDGFNSKQSLEPGSYFTLGYADDASNFVGDTTATRSLTGGVLQPGQSFDITTAPAEAYKNGAQYITDIGFSLLDASGNTLFSLFVEGGSNNNFYTDSTNTATKISGVGYSFELPDNVVFTLTNATTGAYQLTISGSGVTGGSDTITGTIGSTSGISQFQLFYNSAGQGDATDNAGQFNNFAVVPEPSTQAMLIVGASALAVAAIRRRRALGAAALHRHMRRRTASRTA